jgi:hypothetical protein
MEIRFSEQYVYRPLSSQGRGSSKNIHIKYEVNVEEILTRAQFVERGEPVTRLQGELATQLQEKDEYPVYVR